MPPFISEWRQRVPVTWRALSTLLRYRARIQREHDRALQALTALRQWPRPAAASRSEPEPARVVASPAQPRLVAARAAGPDEPESPRAMNGHQRRTLAAMRRKRAA